MTLTESRRETEAPKADSLEPSATVGVREDVHDRRAEVLGASSEKGARHEALPARSKLRRSKPWRIRVVRIDAQKYPRFQFDREHPFSALAREARVEEIDAFLARLVAFSKKLGPRVGGGVNPAPRETLAASETARRI